MSERAGLENCMHMYRHACHAWEDFSALRKQRRIQRRNELWHSISHHLRHVVYRSGLQLRKRRRVRRSGR
jgi:hypothetical protein